MPLNGVELQEVKRAWWGIIGVMLLAAAVWNWWPFDTAASSVTPLDAPAPHHAPWTSGAQGSARGSRIAGSVWRGAELVRGAQVTLRMAQSQHTLSGEDGEFSFENVPSGQAYVSASTDTESTDVVGPVEVNAWTRIDGLRLSLMPAVKVEGVVFDVATHRPIAGAVVLSPSLKSVTDARGQFSFRGARVQTWLEVSAPGYLSRLDWVSMELVASGGRLELALTPTSWIEGTVLESGAPSSGATVWAENVGGPLRGGVSEHVVTDALGRFVLPVRGGTLSVLAVTKSGLRAKGPTVRLALSERQSGVVIDAGDGLSAAGQLTFHSRPLGGAQLVALDAATEAVVAQTASQADGNFRFDVLPLGTYVLQIRWGTRTAQVGPMSHRGDGQLWMVTVPEGTTLRGRVEPPAPGVAVRWQSGQWAGPLVQTVTNAAGEFYFEGLPDGWISLEAEGPAGTAMARVHAGEEVVLTLKKSEVIVAVQRDDGRPATDGVLWARHLETGVSRRRAVLAPDGVFRMELPLGRWQVGFDAAGGGRSRPADVVLADGAVELRLVLESTASVEGRVVEKRTQLPVVGARVEWVATDVGRERVSVLSDERGYFVLQEVPQSAALVASRTGFVSQWRKVAEGPRWDVSLEAAPQPAGNGLNQFEGVGMTLDGRSGQVMVSSIVDGSPAERAGVLSGDRILAVDTVSVEGQSLEAIVQRIRGPAGTPVVLLIERGGQRLELAMRRRMLTL